MDRPIQLCFELIWFHASPISAEKMEEGNPSRNIYTQQKVSKKKLSAPLHIIYRSQKSKRPPIPEGVS